MQSFGGSIDESRDVVAQIGRFWPQGSLESGEVPLVVAVVERLNSIQNTVM